MIEHFDGFLLRSKAKRLFLLAAFVGPAKKVFFSCWRRKHFLKPKFVTRVIETRERERKRIPFPKTNPSVFPSRKVFFVSTL